MRSSSLGWRLIRRIVLVHFVLAAVMTAIVLGVISASGLIVDENAAAQIEAIEDAIHIDDQGRLTLEETKEVHALHEQTDLWFVVKDSQGRTLSHGNPPPEYPLLEARIQDLSFAHRISYWTEPGRRFASARLLAIDVGGQPAALMIGVGQKLTLWQILGGALVVFVLYGLPLTLVTAAVAAPLIVLVVRRTLAPLDMVMKEAGRIDINAPGVRLSEGHAPKEVAPLIAAVNRALGRLEDGYRTQARFMTDAAHELRTPVAILQTRIESLSPGGDRDALSRDVARLALLCEQLLDLQRINSTTGDRTAVDLGQLARQCAADLAPLAIAAKREIGLEVIGANVVLGDGPALTRALSNLVMNALQHGAGRISLIVRECAVTVADEGPGIALEQRHKVFEPFRRLKPLSTGSGLGLALVKEIAALHGGRVEIGERPGGGAAITFFLSPQTAPPANRDATVRPPA